MYMNGIKIGFQIFMNMIEIFIFVFYLDSFEREKRVGNKVFWFCNILYMIGITTVNLCSGYHWFNLCTSVIFTFLISMLYKAGWLDIVIWDCVYLGFCIIAELCAAFIIILCCGSYAAGDEWNYIEGAVLSKILTLFLISFLVYGKRKREGKANFPIHTRLVLSLVSVQCMFITMCFADNMEIYEKNQVINCILGMCCMFSLDFLIFVCFKQMQKIYDKLFETERLNHEIAVKESYYKELEERQYEIRKIQHDIKNQLLGWNGKNQNPLAQEFVENMLDKLTDEKKYCENPFINAILEEKITQAKKYNILVSHDICVADNLQIDAGDMGVLIGNLLDNAIEAGQCVAEPFITINMFQRSTNLLIQIKNKKEQGATLMIGDTTKKDKWNHGFGLKSVKQIVKKYGGTMDIDMTEDVFEVKIIIFL